MTIGSQTGRNLQTLRYVFVHVQPPQRVPNGSAYRTGGSR